MLEIQDRRETVRIGEAAVLMGVHVQTARELVKSGELPAGRIGKATVLLRSDVLKFIENKIMIQTVERRKQLMPGAPQPKRERRKPKSDPLP